jgi:hypothetical protein
MLGLWHTSIIGQGPMGDGHWSSPQKAIQMPSSKALNSFKSTLKGAPWICLNENLHMFKIPCQKLKVMWVGLCEQP